MLAFVSAIAQTGGVQGKPVGDREFLDAAALCGHLVRAGSVEAFLAEHRQRLFSEAFFADLFPSGRGRPSIPGDVIGTVMVFLLSAAIWLEARINE